MIEISLVLALRSQPKEFTNLIESISRLTEHKDSVEILVVIDNDDAETYEFIYSIKYDIPIAIRPILTDRSLWYVRDYYNYAERMANGRWIMNINADSLFKTKGWDSILCNKMGAVADKVGDDILYGIVDDCLKEKDNTIGFSCWSLSSKEYVNLMGGIMDGRIPAWGADVALGQVFSLIDNGRRKVFIPEISIDHISHHVYKNIKPAIHVKRFRKMEHDFPTFLTPEQIQESADKVNRYINAKSIL